MDALGAHSLWGFTPAVDLLEVAAVNARVPVDGEEDGEPIEILLDETGDVRHVLKTIAQRLRHTRRPVHFYVHERVPEVLARHLLLLSVAFDWEIPLRQRANLWLEIFGNCFVQERTSRFVAEQRVQLIDLVCNRRGPLASLVDCSLLRYKQVDALEETFQAWGHRVECDMAALWDQRLRHHYKTRFDFKANLIDWDYQMVVRPSAGNIHSQEFRRWRTAGLAFEFGDETYTLPNRSMVSFVEGRERGLSTLRRGFWGDVVLSPYHTIGTSASLPSEEEVGAEPAKHCRQLFDIMSRHTGSEQFRHSATQLAVFNVLAFLFEIETGTRYALQQAHDVYSGVGATHVVTAASSKDAAAGPASGASATAEGSVDLESLTHARAVLRAKSIARTLRGVRIFPVSGPLEDLMTRKRFHHRFDVVALGGRAVHQMAHPTFLNLVADRATFLTETARNVVLLQKDQRDEYERRVASMAGTVGAVFAGTDRTLLSDRFGVGSVTDVRSKEKKEAEAALRRRQREGQRAVKERLGEHAEGLFYLQDVMRWDADGGDNPRPEHLVFRFDRDRADERKKSFRDVLELIRPMQLGGGEAGEEKKEGAGGGAGGGGSAGGGGGGGGEVGASAADTVATSAESRVDGTSMLDTVARASSSLAVEAEADFERFVDSRRTEAETEEDGEAARGGGAEERKDA